MHRRPRGRRCAGQPFPQWEHHQGSGWRVRDQREQREAVAQSERNEKAVGSFWSLEDARTC